MLRFYKPHLTTVILQLNALFIRIDFSFLRSHLIMDRLATLCTAKMGLRLCTFQLNRHKMPRFFIFDFADNFDLLSRTKVLHFDLFVSADQR